MTLNQNNGQQLKYIACGGEKPFEVAIEKDITINKKLADIEVVQEDGVFYIKWDGRQYVGEIIEKNQNKYTVLMNGVSYNFTIETPISFKRRQLIEQQQGKSKNLNIAAPMPGKIIEILAEENTLIKEGETVFILEAMKMQNEILSHVSGKVTKINVRQNENVEKGTVLVEIE